MPEYDIVIPVSYKDCWFLRKNIPYIRRNLVGAQKIYVLTSLGCFDEFSQEFCDVYNVVLLNENELVTGLSYPIVRNALSQHQMSDMTGWYFQQFLKMAFALSVYVGDYYLVWDADTIPLHSITFFAGETILINPKKEYHKPYFETLQRLFGIGKNAEYSFISEHMMMKRSIIIEMIQSISAEGNWWDAIIEKCDFTKKQAFSEFEAIGTYCLVHHPELYQLRHLSTFRGGGSLFGRQVTDKELTLLGVDFDTVSFERNAKPLFPRSIRWGLERLLVELKYRIKCTN